MQKYSFFPEKQKSFAENTIIHTPFIISKSTNGSHAHFLYNVKHLPSAY